MTSLSFNHDLKSVPFKSNPYLCAKTHVAPLEIGKKSQTLLLLKKERKMCMHGTQIDKCSFFIGENLHPAGIQIAKLWQNFSALDI